MVESSDTDKSSKDAVCATCGKSVGAAVSGATGEWSFRPVCRCSSTKEIELPPTAPKNDADAMRDTSDTERADSDAKRDDTSATPAASDPEPVENDAVFVKGEDVSEVDSGGWATVNSAKIASGPNFSRTSKSKIGESGSWKNASSPKSFKDDNLNSSDSNDSWIEVGSDDDFAGPVVGDFNRPVVHEVAKMSTSGATSSSTSSSGTNLGVSYSSSTNLSGAASAAYRRAKSSTKEVEEPADWVPVKPQIQEKPKSQFADHAELLDLTHKTETAEERAAKPDTRKNIQGALRRNRIKTMIVAVILLALGYGFYSYANSKGLLKKVGILSQFSNSGQQSKKGSGRHSKKNKRTN